MCVSAVAYGNHTTVATSQPASHDSFDRHLDGVIRRGCQSCHGRQHRLRPTRIKTGVAGCCQVALERDGHPTVHTARAVFGRQHELHTKALEPFHVEQVGCAACRRSTDRDRVPRRVSASASVANGARPTPPATIHASLWRRHRHEWLSERTETQNSVAWLRVVQPSSADANALAQQGQSSHAMATIPQNLEDREGATQQRIVLAARLDHDKLAGFHLRRQSPELPARARCSRKTGGDWQSRRLPRPTALPEVYSYDFAMRYLRMLTNSVVGGLIVAAYLTVLVLHLNPALGLDPKGADSTVCDDGAVLRCPCRRVGLRVDCRVAGSCG